ncbi:MAG: hypothetical protein Q8O55_07315 [Dehalococcoidales bacterium]|nr:hypothetical protein [Dehalococcoidales bacterium]
MKLELKDDKGLIGTMELPIEELRAGLGLDSASAENAKLAEEVKGQLAEKDTEIANLKEELAEAKSPTGLEDLIIATLNSLSPEGRANLAEEVPGWTYQEAEPEPVIEEKVAVVDTPPARRIRYVIKARG